MFKPKNQIEDFSHSITKNCETIIDQTYGESEETLEFKLSKSRKSFSFNPPLQTQWSWMIGLINLEVNNSFFLRSQKKTINSNFILRINKIRKELHLKIEKTCLKKNLGVSHIENDDLLDEQIGNNIIGKNREINLEKWIRMDTHFY